MARPHAGRLAWRSPLLRRLACLAFACVLTTMPVGWASADVDEVSAAAKRRERKTFSDAEISDGFFRTAFGAEYHLSGRVDRVRKYEGPVRVFVSGDEFKDRRAQIGRIVADIGRHIAHIDIGIVSDEDEANVLVRLIRDRDLNRTLARVYGRERAREIGRSLDPQCLSGFRKNEQFQIERSDVFLTVDNGDFVFLDCAYEEILQSLGPINDTDKVPWTMFNDDVSMGYFDVYDQYILNILYDPRIKAGMSPSDVKSVLPDVLADVRTFVTKTNGLKP